MDWNIAGANTFGSIFLFQEKTIVFITDCDGVLG